MELRRLKILQHNVRHWPTNKINLCNVYREIDPEVILINSHGCTTEQPIKIFNYNVHRRNNSQQQHDGVAIAIRKNIRYHIIDDFNDEIMAIKVTTTLGDLILATAYLPPRRNYLPIPDFLKLLNYNCPVYILGDLNAKHRIFDDNNNNEVGSALNTYVRTGQLMHLGPHFPTFIGHRSLTRPDKVLTNNKAFFNYFL